MREVIEGAAAVEEVNASILEEVAEKHASEPQPDAMLFHDVVALAARIEDEAKRCRDIGWEPGVDAKTAHAAGIAFAKLNALEAAMFDATSTIRHLASEMGLDASPSGSWSQQKEACRRARRQAREAIGRLGPLSDAAVSG